MNRFDIAIVGSGFGGSLLAMIAKKLGRSVILLERHKHPRFAIGESSTPLTNLLWEEITQRYGLHSLKPLAKWGTWQDNFPEIGCGLKRGFTFYRQTLGSPAMPRADRANHLLVEASPHDAIADTHWFRADFDNLLVNEAQKSGVKYLDQIELRRVSECGDGWHIECIRGGSEEHIQAQFIVDATGPRGVLHRMFELPERELPGMPATQALYSHFSGVGRIQDLRTKLLDEEPPYPVDDAAVHHVFDGGWVWVLRFNNGITSAGVAAVDKVAQQLSFEDGSPAWQRLLDLIPQLKEQFDSARPEQRFTHIPRLSFRSGVIAGRRWALLPSAAGFVDPLLSTGFPLTLLGISRIAELLERDWDREDFQAGLDQYAARTDTELLVTARLIGSLYRSMRDFPLFTSLTFLYFTAVIYSETARRLGRSELASSFLLHDRLGFGPECLKILDRADHVCTAAESLSLQSDIARLIEPLNLAGLGDTCRRNWYPVNAADLYRNAWKMEATPDEISALLERSGFQQSASAGVSST